VLPGKKNISFNEIFERKKKLFQFSGDCGKMKLRITILSIMVLSTMN
jgi:hypothetical protein